MIKGKKRAVLAKIRANALDDSTPYYEKIKEQDIPVLLTWGENDRSIPLESVERLLKLIPDIQFHKIEKALHLAHYEFPEKVNLLLIDFFKNDN